MAVIESIATGPNPTGLGIDPIINKAMVANKDSKSVTIITLQNAPVPDTQSPVITQPQNIQIEATGANGANVSYNLPVVTDNLDPNPTVTCTPSSGLLFALGSTPVSCTANDAAGNTASSNFLIDVVDTNPPVITPPVDLTKEAIDTTGVTVAYPQPTVTDTVDVNPLLICNPATGSIFILGNTAVSCTANDAAGNTASSNFAINVVDTTPPVIPPLALITVEAVDAQGATATYSLPSITDTVDPNPTVICAPASGSVFPIGTTQVNCTATDATGNNTPRTFDIVIQDTMAPVLSALQGMTVDAADAQGATVVYTSPTVSDSVDPNPVVSCQPVSGSVFPVGINTVSCSATDNAANQSQSSFTVTVNAFADTVPPTMTQPANLTEEATGATGATVHYVLPSVLDDQDPNPSVTCIPAPGTLFSLGNTPVSCTVSDAAGNTANGSFTVNVVDTSAPILLSAPANIVVDLPDAQTQNIAVNYTLPTLYDLVDPAPTLLCLPASGTFFVLGVTSINCSTSDINGNQGLFSFSVTVNVYVPDLPPVMNSSPDVVREANDAAGSVVYYTLPVVIDDRDLDLRASCIPAGGSLFPLGTNLVTCSVTDSSGNTAQSTINIIVQDTAPPMLTPPPNAVVNSTTTSTIVDIGIATATDVSSFNITHNAPAAFPFGTSYVEWIATDSNGNKNAATQTITVVDATPSSLAFVRPAAGFLLTNRPPLEVSFNKIDTATGTFQVNGINLPRGF